MNERIQELWEEATVSMWPRPGKFTAGEYDYHLEKFAELIVAECIGKCEFVANIAEITNTGEMARKTKATADSCATMIKEHFGVEE
jgi:hypothetical protein